MKHIYSCNLWNKENVAYKPRYKNIFSVNVKVKVKVNEYIAMNWKTRETSWDVLISPRLI
jgi:hypothetical protein